MGQPWGGGGWGPHFRSGPLPYPPDPPRRPPAAPSRSIRSLAAPCGVPGPWAARLGGRCSGGCQAPVCAAICRCSACLAPISASRAEGGNPIATNERIRFSRAPRTHSPGSSDTRSSLARAGWRTAQPRCTPACHSGWPLRSHQAQSGSPTVVRAAEICVMSIRACVIMVAYARSQAGRPLMRIIFTSCSTTSVETLLARIIRGGPYREGADSCSGKCFRRSRCLVNRPENLGPARG